MTEVEFRLGGGSVVVQMEDNETILDCALRNSLNAPYSCMEGVCSSCLAIVREGEVDFVMEDAKGVKTIQTCQSKPKPGTKRLVIDYHV